MRPCRCGRMYRSAALSASGDRRGRSRVSAHQPSAALTLQPTRFAQTRFTRALSVIALDALDGLAARRALALIVGTGARHPLERRAVAVVVHGRRLGRRLVAARFGRTIVYIPIGQLSPVTMKKIRVVHVLDGYDKRDAAKEYIW